MVESIVSLTHEAFGQRALVVEIMAEGMRNPQVAAMLKNKHMTITEFVAQRMRDAQQKGEISPDINTAMTSRLLLDLTYGVLADIEAEDLAREASFAQGLRAMIGGILTASLILSLSFRGLMTTEPAFHIVISLCKKSSSPGSGEFPPKYSP